MQPPTTEVSVRRRWRTCGGAGSSSAKKGVNAKMVMGPRATTTSGVVMEKEETETETETEGATTTTTTTTTTGVVMEKEKTETETGMEKEEAMATARAMLRCHEIRLRFAMRPL